MKYIWSFAIAILLTSQAVAMEHVSRSLQDLSGNAISGASVTVYNAGTTVKAAIFSDNGVTSKANPFTTGIDGVYNFYAANGLYDVTFSHARHLFLPDKTKRFALFDPRQGVVQDVKPISVSAYTVLDGDRGKLVSFCNGTTPVEVTLAAPSASQFINGWNVYLQNRCQGEVTITVTGGVLIDFDNPVVLTQNAGMYLASDGISYYSIRGGGGGGGGGGGTWSSLLASGAMGTSESVRFSIRGIGGQSTNGRDMYQSSGGLWVDVCVVANVQNACNYIRQLAAGFKTEVTNHLAVPIFTLPNDTGVLSNVILVDETHWDVASCQGSTPSAIFNLPIANAPTPFCEGANTRLGTLDFNDTTDQSFHGRWKLPPGFQPSLGIDIHGVWKGVNTTNAVGWCFQMVRVPDGATSDPAQPAQAAGNCVSDTAKGISLQENTFTFTHVTCTSCVAGDSINWILSRDANGGAVTDSFVGDAKLITFGRTWRVKKQS